MPLINLGVKALLSWVNNITSTHREINIEELQDGELLLRIVYKLKNEPNPPLTNSTEERFNLIEEFVEKICRFSPTKGTPLSWDNIRNGINLTVEIAKVVLLLFYHDLMSGRCTLKTLDWEVERAIANLTDSFVMESDGCVYLRSSLDAYLAKRNLPVTDEILARVTSTSSSGVSTVSSLSDEDSPVFHCTKKISFVEMHTVASSSVSKSPLQDLMTTPKFQLRRMQGQMIQEREYRDGLERELTSKIGLIAQNESHINQLQYRLDKMKREQSDQEHSTREQINELETKNCSLQQRLNEILKENKDCKNNCSLMERKVCELEEENGVLSSQMRTAYAQLSIFEAEVRRLTETQAAGQEEWRARIDDLQSELNQATAEKELLTEQIKILQGKLSCMEDEIRAARKKDVGENMGPVIERDELEREVDHLKNELNSTFGCLKKAEANVEAKMQQLSAYEEEVTMLRVRMQAQDQQKTPGGVEADETFYSLASARSQPDLSGARPVSMELFDTPAKMAGAANDQLIGLPGCRRSALHSQPTSTFCVGAENEPDAASDDWMRIAELQARNKACPPHLKSSYRLEFETGFKSIFAFTDEDVRTGDPTETIRRASVMPGQLQDSLASHRHSLAAGQSSATASIRSHRLSLMADYPASKSVSSSQLKCTKRSTSTLSVPQMSPEKKLKASCFPRPLTPKNKNSGSRPSNSQLHPALSPAERRQSTMFSIENTPKNSRSSNYLKKGLNKLRNSSRKSPGKTSKTSPVNAVGKAATSRAAASRAGKEGSFKSPQTANKSAKSPRLTASARKMMGRRM
ncbi:uncharacterized protein LOC144052270 isoform X2 [Vanacampus margaritifer]